MALLCAVTAFIMVGQAAVGPNNPELIFQRAAALHQAGDADRAIGLYREYLKLRPDSVEARSNLGVALAGSGRYSEAADAYREALKRRPGDRRIRLNLTLAQYKGGQFSAAAAGLDSLHREMPGDRQTLLLLADCRLRLGENRVVIDLLAPAEQGGQGDLAIAYLLGTALLRDKQVERAQPVIDRILRNGDSAEARLLVGIAKLEALEFEASIADLKKAAALKPELAEVHSSLGQAHIQMGDAAAARVAFQRELALNPNDFESNLQLGALLRQDQDFEGARRLLERALRVRAGDVRTRFQLALLRLGAGRLEEARVGLERIIGDAPQFVEAHVTLAGVYYRLKRKGDGDREKALAEKLTRDKQARRDAGRID